jgi:threonine/homoserine/homoserine lactone efflux protein
MIINAIPTLFVGVWFLGGAKYLIYLAYQEEFEKGQS